MHIALVEDERKLAATLKEGLEAEGHEVDLFFDGKTAEEGILEGASRYTLAILDLMLPKKDGLEVCRALRQKGVALPIIVLTARDTLEDKVRALDSGADDFLTKPFEFEELMARMRAIARRAQPRASERMTIGELAVDLRVRETTFGGRVIALTPTEFELLVFLMENADRPVPREEISAHLWEVKDTSLSNIVDVHISNLRKKLGDTHGNNAIRTIRGLGYRVEA